MNWTKYSGWYLFGTGVIHNLIGIVLGWPSLVGMHQSGWLSSTIVENVMLFDREAILWFLTLGAFWMVMGLTLQQVTNQGYKLPPFLGWGIILISILLIIIVPVSGAYLVLIQGGFIVIGDTRNKAIATYA